MTCEPHEQGLALAIEGDLPMRQRAPLERHLQQCARCQEFLQGLKESQRKLKGLATEPLDEAALAAVRTRVVAAVHESARRPVIGPAWSWMLAASLAVVALALAIAVGRTTRTPSRQTDGFLPSPPAPRAVCVTPAVPAEMPALTVTRSDPGRATAPPPRRGSTARVARAVSGSVNSSTARVVPELSPDDADQLARAVVAVSRIRRVTDRPREPLAEPLPPAVVRLSTSDPGVVIYWQLDSKGG